MARMRDLINDVWCKTCKHTHIPDIPVTTFKCAGDKEYGCGFGVWELDIASDHASRYPDHIVYPLHHETILLGDRYNAN